MSREAQSECQKRRELILTVVIPVSAPTERLILYGLFIIAAGAASMRRLSYLQRVNGPIMIL